MDFAMLLIGLGLIVDAGLPRYVYEDVRDGKICREQIEADDVEVDG